MKALKNEAIVATVKLGFVLDRSIVVNVWNLETWFIVHWAYATTHIHIGVNKSKYLKQKREMKWSKKYFVSKTSGNIYIYLSLSSFRQKVRVDEEAADLLILHWAYTTTDIYIGVNMAESLQQKNK